MMTGSTYEEGERNGRDERIGRKMNFSVPRPFRASQSRRIAKRWGPLAIGGRERRGTIV
jgi:hypothetical protein